MKDKSFAGIYLDVSNFDESSSEYKALAKKTGWKFHIALNQDIEGNIEKGWNILVELVVKHKIASLKVIKPGTPALNNKVITIYAFKDTRPNQNWHQILTEITSKFVEQKVYPATLPEDDYQIEGSLYFTHRSDDDGYGNYTTENIIPVEESPFKDFLVEVQGQRELLEESITVLENQAHEVSVEKLDRASKTSDSSTTDTSSEMTDDKIALEFNQKNVIIQDDDDDNDPGCCNI